MVEATERLEQRILLALLRQPRPLDWFGNALQGKALRNLMRRGWVHLTSGDGPNGTATHQLAMLTPEGTKRAWVLWDERQVRIARHRKKREKK